MFFSWISWNGCRDDNRFVYDIQLATPSEPAMAVSTAMRILRSCFQFTFIVIRYYSLVCRGIPCGCPVGVGAGAACPSVVGADRCVCPIMVSRKMQGEHIGSPLRIAVLSLIVDLKVQR